MAFFIFSQPLIAWRASLGTPRPSTPIVPASARVAGPWQRSMGDESGVFNSRAEYLLKMDLTTAVQDVLAMVTSEKVATQPWRNVLNSHTTSRPWGLGGGCQPHRGLLAHPLYSPGLGVRTRHPC